MTKIYGVKVGMFGQYNLIADSITDAENKGIQCCKRDYGPMDSDFNPIVTEVKYLFDLDDPDEEFEIDSFNEDEDDDGENIENNDEDDDLDFKL